MGGKLWHCLTDKKKRQWDEEKKGEEANLDEIGHFSNSLFALEDTIYKMSKANLIPTIYYFS